jgi:hypothetical protein
VVGNNVRWVSKSRVEAKETRISISSLGFFVNRKDASQQGRRQHSEQELFQSVPHSMPSIYHFFNGLSLGALRRVNRTREKLPCRSVNQEEIIEWLKW